MLLWILIVEAAVDARAHIEAPVSPPACTATVQHECTLDTSSGPVQVSVSYGGVVFASTATPHP